MRVYDGFPLPPSGSGLGRVQMVVDPARPRPAKFSGLTAALLRMRLGQSVFLRGIPSGRVHVHLRYAVARGRAFTVRQGRRGSRVWLVATIVDGQCVVASGL